ncbi:U6 small nuclear RNA (adenine-(43)-N(6))-methyltransferase [Dermatophagoides pteronyssinus]|uniref:U6 small nuclear RNA (adenine-(43)-N(6))-methyltransferase n=1 Tax=Dermatophagoides pteronyssinus TaxID=6956 RepID=A0A6P6YEX3_DERPT|nr:U6 small nuclear RNA (adenine-(43)-N(6))-methyltransferase-like [Dermatophagoides pteronyssinus]
MAFNQFMHPRNIYRKKLDYDHLGREYPEFGQHVCHDEKGKSYIDYSDIVVLRSLTKTLLKNDFHLDVQIPEQRLVPTIPMRLNYILWIEDLLQHCRLFYQIQGIDIGTGSCSIFPLLATILNPDWRFIATEIDPINLDYANKNVTNNNLNDKIIIYDNRNIDTIFKHLVQNSHFTFVMTNPPFFEDTFNDSFENINDKKPNDRRITFHQRKTNSASSDEAICDGGELVFIKRILDESLQTKKLVDLYTVMVGRKKTFLELKYLLKDMIKNKTLASFAHTELCQGNTKRWALAWTFDERFNLANSPKILQSKPKPLIHYLDQDIKACDYKIESIGNYIENLLLNDLHIEQFQIIKLNKRIEFDIKSNEANWKNQRRKRREKLSKELMEKIAEDDFIAGKRSLDDDDDNNHNSNKKFSQSNELCKTNLTYLLHCSLIIKRDKQDILIKMETKQMSQNKSATYELLQYFKNKLT